MCILFGLYCKIILKCKVQKHKKIIIIIIIIIQKSEKMWAEQQ